jgi:hypothetical protein
VELNPWPALFDHSMVVIEDSSGDLILDPSDPRSGVGLVPPRLRGKSYLVADGESGLRTVREKRWPSTGLSWEFGIETDSEGVISSDFEIRYINDASVYLPYFSGDGESGELTVHFQNLIRDAGWQTSFLKIDSVTADTDTLTVAGSMEVRAEGMGGGAALSVGSPIVAYLLENIFIEARASDLCDARTLHLEEFVRIGSAGMVYDGPAEHDEIWVRDGIEFSDQLAMRNGNILFRRVYNSDGSRVTAEDYNEFRDILLSLRNQRYLDLVSHR